MPPIPAAKSLFMTGCKGKALSYSTKKLLLWSILKAEEANLKLELWFFSLGVATCGWHKGCWHGSILGEWLHKGGDAASQEESIGKSKSAEMSWTTIHAQPSLSMGKWDCMHLKAKSSKAERRKLTTDVSKLAFQLTGIICARNLILVTKNDVSILSGCKRWSHAMCPNSPKVFIYKYRAVCSKSTCMQSCIQPLTICTSHSGKAKLVQHLEMNAE